MKPQSLTAFHPHRQDSLSSDVFEEINEKIDLYQKVGVPLVWVIDPHDRTITIYRLDAEPELVNIHEELNGDPHLPGFRVAVKEIFA